MFFSHLFRAPVLRVGTRDEEDRIAEKVTPANPSVSRPVMH